MAKEPRCKNCIWGDKQGCITSAPCPYHYTLLEIDDEVIIEENRESFREEWFEYARESLEELFC